MATLILLVSLPSLAMNVFLPSLPGMTAYFQTDYGVMQLAVASYLGANAIFQIVIGPISDKFGRRPVLLWCIGLFLLATLGCLFAPNVWVFLLFRMAQAFIVAGMTLARAAIRDVMSIEQSASAMGYVTMGTAIVAMVGPSAGGVLDQAYGWQASFWLMVGLGIVVFSLAWVDLGETKAKSGLSLLAQFREYPELFASPRFWGYTLALSFGSGSFFAYLGGAPFIATEIYGMPTMVMGFYFSAPAVGYFVGNYISGRYSVRAGVNRMVLWGSLTNALGPATMLGLFATGLGSVEGFFALMTLVGLGNGMLIPNATAGALSVRQHLAGTASGLSGAIMLVIGAALSALAGALLSSETGAYPLLWLMWATSTAGSVASGLVILRTRRLHL